LNCGESFVAFIHYTAMTENRKLTINCPNSNYNIYWNLGIARHRVSQRITDPQFLYMNAIAFGGGE
jgi:hypothetical protein